jgi:hypothetical protein
MTENMKSEKENRRSQKMPLVEPGVYRHYSGKFYSVIGLVREDDTGDIYVLKIPLYLVEADTVPTQMSMRKLEEFCAVVNKNGQRLRFQKVN